MSEHTLSSGKGRAGWGWTRSDADLNFVLLFFDGVNFLCFFFSLIFAVVSGLGKGKLRAAYMDISSATHFLSGCNGLSDLTIMVSRIGPSGTYPHKTLHILTLHCPLCGSHSFEC